MVLSICSESVQNEIHPLKREPTTIRTLTWCQGNKKQLYFLRFEICLSISVFEYFNFNCIHSWHLNKECEREGCQIPTQSKSTYNFRVPQNLTTNSSQFILVPKPPTDTKIHRCLNKMVSINAYNWPSTSVNYQPQNEKRSGIY